jgi:hypothetical protein
MVSPFGIRLKTSRHANQAPSFTLPEEIYKQVMLTVLFDTDRLLLLDFIPHYDTINANHYCQVIQSCGPRSRTITVNSLTVSACYMTAPATKWPKDLRTDQMPCNWRCSNILHIGQTYHHTILTPLRSLKKAI